MSAIQTTSGAHLANRIRFRKIDELTRSDHYYLTDDDVCLFLIEKTSHRDYSFSAQNQLIANIKKNPATSNEGELFYKRRDIGKCSWALKQAFDPDWLKDAVLVPVPPSKAKNHREYDDRMERICRGIDPSVDVRDLVAQNTSMLASHERGPDDRISLDELLEAYAIDEELAAPEPLKIGIVDDVLTAGTHYRAVHTVLSERFPDAEIIGIFVARRVFPDDGFDF
ncbi:MAG: hypothetical protein OEN23_18000 [Paracoccaceae bacterium]|nr:hypothetical protein [Paracoccaceae bacterium]